MSGDGNSDKHYVVLVAPPLATGDKVDEAWLNTVAAQLNSTLSRATSASATKPDQKTRLRGWAVAQYLWQLVKKVEAFLALIALAFACIQYHDAKINEVSMRNTEASMKNTEARMKGTEAGMKSALDELQDVAAKQSTQYLGEFPLNMATINSDVIDPKRVSKEVIILTDYPGYGHYTAPEMFETYRQDIITAVQNGHHVRMLVYSDKEAHVMVDDQFRRDAFDKATRVSPKFFAYFKNNPREPGPPTTYDEFSEALLHKQREYERQFCSWGVEIEHYDSPASIFFWVSDQRNAVISFNKRDQEGREETFSTKDGKLISALDSVFQRMWDESEGSRVHCDFSKQAAAAPPAPATSSGSAHRVAPTGNGSAGSGSGQAASRAGT
jgi:hypothetical protein